MDAGSGVGGDASDHGKKPSTDSKVIDHMPAKWTNEMHSMFLNSIEASFIDHLYSTECRSKVSLGCFSRKQNHSSGSYLNGLSHDQFKVQRRGCWENLYFEKGMSRADIETESRLLSENQWKKYFRSPSIGKDKHHISFDGMDTDKLAGQSIHLRSQRCGDEAAKEQLVACSHMYRDDYFGSSTEVSDQNFVDKEFEGEEKQSNTHRKKRVKTTKTDVQFKDQVVPSGIPFQPPSSDEADVCLKGKDVDSKPDPHISHR